MKSAIDRTEKHILLLSTIDLEEVCEIAAELAMELFSAKAVAICLYDPDLEIYNDTFVYGPLKKDFNKFALAFAETAHQLDEHKGAFELDPDEVDEALPSKLEPVIRYGLVKDGVPCATILIAGHDVSDPKTVDEELDYFPLSTSLANSWEVRELRRENERLRDRYDDLESQNQNLEEQTRKLISDMTVNATLRHDQVEREKLVFEISNAVRSSLEIQQVLLTAVNKIGASYHLSRCMLLRRPHQDPNGLNVYEYHDSSVSSARDLFHTEAGMHFVSVALSKSAPHDFSEFDDETTFDKQFLKDLGVLSGLLVPLIIRDRIIGAIFLMDCSTPREWSIDNTALFGSLADQLSVAIENADLHEEKAQQAVTDGLTGIANRRHFNETFAKEFERARRYGEPLSLVVVDLDYLKKINDTYGHQVGDQAIQLIGTVMKNSCRSIDLPARYGGEEFVLLLPNTPVEEAATIAERLRKLINEVPIEGPGQVSASIGVSNFPLHATEPESLFEAADTALYKAKEGGRNRVCIADDAK